MLAFSCFFLSDYHLFSPRALKTTRLFVSHSHLLALPAHLATLCLITPSFLFITSWWHPVCSLSALSPLLSLTSNSCLIHPRRSPRLMSFSMLWYSLSAISPFCSVSLPLLLFCLYPLTYIFFLLVMLLFVVFFYLLPLLTICLSYTLFPCLPLNYFSLPWWHLPIHVALDDKRSKHIGKDECFIFMLQSLCFCAQTNFPAWMKWFLIHPCSGKHISCLN